MNVRESLVGHASAVARLYDKWSAGMSSAAWYRDDRILTLLDSIRTYRPRAVLEIGFGDGRVLQRLARRMPDCQFYGVDLSATMIAAAEKRCLQQRNVHLFLGDWIRPALGRSYDVILIKNTLHLIPNIEKALVELERVSHSGTKLVIVETVSPSVVSRNFVQSIFQIIDREGVKQNYFTRQSLLALFSGLGWKREYLSLLDQTMSVNEWLKFKVDTQLERAAVKHEILNAPNEVVRQMNITFDSIHLSMLRRQVIVFLSRGTNVIKGPFGAA